MKVVADQEIDQKDAFPLYRPTARAHKDVDLLMRMMEQLAVQERL